MTNVVLVAVAELVLGSGQSPAAGDTVFFVFLVSILTMLYDRYRPVNEYRIEAARAETEVRPSTAR